MMRVAIVVDTLKLGGAQRLVAAYAASATAHGISPVIITLSRNSTPFLLESIRSTEGVKLITLPAASLFDLRRLRQLVRIFEQEKVTLVQTHLIYSNILGVLAAHIARIPVIATLHSTAVRNSWKAKVLHGLENIVLRRYATRILAVGQLVADMNKGSYGKRKVNVIPNGIPKPKFPPVQERERLRREITANGSDPIVITVGRFTRAKGYQDMIEAFRILQQKQTRPTLVMVGSGSTVDTIKTQIEDSNLEQSVILTGEREDVHQLLALSDVYASSSHREGLPLAVLEAMMAGLPVVATSVGDIPNVVTEDTGVVVPPHRPELLAEALEDLLNNPKKRQAMGQAAYRRAMSEYSVDAWMKKHLALYREVLSTNGHGTSK